MVFLVSIIPNLLKVGKYEEVLTQVVITLRGYSQGTLKCYRWNWVWDRLPVEIKANTLHELCLLILGNQVNHRNYDDTCKTLSLFQKHGFLFKMDNTFYWY